MAAKSVKKIMEESKAKGYEEIDLQDKGIVNISDVPHLCKLHYDPITYIYHNFLP